jgi:serine/threonine-protein kinase
MTPPDSILARAQARVGTVLAQKWALDALLGVGGMAAVYAATHRNSKRVAIKVLHPELSTHRDIRERFLREGYAANQVSHRGTVTVHDDVVTEDGTAFLVMDLLEGETLDERVERNGGTIAPLEVLSHIDQVLDVLEAAHEKGIIHRDLKPENIFLTHDGAVKVLDFGVARVLKPRMGTPITESGVVLGTPAFMAPEQALGMWNEVDARTDIFGLGATMFNVLSGALVHEGSTQNETIALAITRHARPLKTVLPAVRPHLAALVDRALAYEKAKRWQGAKAMHEALELVYAEESGERSTRAIDAPAPPRVQPLAPTPPRVQPLAPTLRSESDAPSMTPDGVGSSVARDGDRRFSSLYRAALGATFAVFAILAWLVWVSVRSPGTSARSTTSPSVPATSPSAPSADEQPPSTNSHGAGSFELLPSRIPAPQEMPPHGAGGVKRFVPVEQRAGAPRASAPTATASEAPPPKPVQSEPAQSSSSASPKWDPFGSRL